jgi:C1A family cysteine protease
MKLVFLFIALLACVEARKIFGGKLLAKNQFEDFKAKYGKQYASAEEESLRFGIFSQNLKHVDQLNSLDSNKPYGVTKFMDLSKQEFASQYLMKNVNLSAVKPGGQQVKEFSNVALPTTFDWNTQTPNCVTGVKNQEQCGSCWAFSAVETIESVCCQAGYGLQILSEQQIVDCDTDGGVQGCNGGWPEDVFTYAERYGGLDTEASYPYQGVDQNCVASQGTLFSCPIVSWQTVSSTAAGEMNMRQFLYSNSVLSIACDAETWQYYTGGVVQASGCGTQLDHAIQLTGWTVVNGQVAWNVRNSWGSDWGNNGYIYLAFGQNACGIATHVTVPCVKNKNGGTQC